MPRPDASEYGDYYEVYVGKVPDGDVLEILKSGVDRTAAVLSGVPEAAETYRYQPGKWSLREVLGHMIDVERVFSFRALSFARCDPSPIPGMDQDRWAAASNAGDRPLASLLDDLRHARASSVAMLASLRGADWDRRGVASGFEFTVRACAYILAGHEIHHRRVLAEKYLEPLREPAG